MNNNSMQAAQMIGHDSIITVNNNEKQYNSLIQPPKVIVSRVKSVS